MSPYEFFPLEAIHGPGFDKRFVRTPMGIYYMFENGQGGALVSEEEALAARTEAREFLKAAETRRADFSAFSAYFSFYKMLFALVLMSMLFSMTGLMKIAGFIIPSVVVGNFLAKPMRAEFIFRRDWRELKAKIDQRFSGRPPVAREIIAPYLRMNPLEIAVKWAAGAVGAVTLGLIVASFMLDTRGNDALMSFAHRYLYPVSIILVALYVLSLGWDRLVGTHADREPERRDALSGARSRRRDL